MGINWSHVLVFVLAMLIGWVLAKKWPTFPILSQAAGVVGA